MSYHPDVKRTLAIPQQLRPFTHKQFAIFWSGAFLSSLGFWVQSVGQGWQVLALSHSPLLLGLVSFISLAPNMVFSLFGGVLVDRFNRRKILIYTQIVYMVATLLLGVLTSLGWIEVWHIMVVALVYGLGSAISFPAWQTFIGDILPPEDLKPGIALNSTQFNLSRVIGPALGGICIVAMGIAGSYYLRAAAFLGVIVPLALMHVEQKVHEQQSESSIWQGVVEGLRYATSNSLVMLLMLLLFLISFLVFPYATLLPIFADSVFHTGAEGLGVLNSAAGIGAAFGSLLTVFFSQRFKHGQNVLVVLCLVGGSTCTAFALSGWLPLSLLFLGILGICTVMSMTVTNTIIQSVVPPEMRGRIVSLWVLVSSGVAPLGNLFAGWVAQSIGAPYTLVFSGMLCLLSVVVVLFMQHYLRTSAQAKIANGHAVK
jgi:MFS family permease